MTCHNTISRIRFLAALVLFCFVAQPALSNPKSPQLANADARKLWREGSGQVLAGDFVSAIKTLERIDQIEPDRPVVKSVLSWMHQARNLTESRERFRQQMYDFYVEKTLKAVKEAREGKSEDSQKESSADALKEPTQKPDHETTASPESKKDEDEEGEKKDSDDEADGFTWSRALFYAQSAMANTLDEDAFRNETWLPKIVENTKLEIKQHKEAYEWRDALALYGILKRIYPDNEEYKKGYIFCRKRAHLDFVYGKKGTWKADLADVTPSAVREILRRIEDDYAEQPDFHKLCRSGLEHLVLLAQATSLSNTFPRLEEQDLVARFVNRINGLIRKRVDGVERFRSRQVRSIFGKVLDANRATLRFPDNVIVDEFVSGMLETLDDFTAVIWPTEVSEFNKQTRGEFVGVGIQITQEVGKAVRVESPLEDSPAYRAGIKPGDLITEVDGKSTIDMTITQAVRLITGESGTIVVLTIKDSITHQSRKIALKRARIKIHTVRGNVRDETKPTGWDYLIDTDQRIGYVRVSGFMDKTVDDLHEALDQMKDEGCRGLILDLRFNPGGLLTSAVNMCDLFLDEGAPIVQTRGRNRHQNMTIRAKEPNQFGQWPLIILVNEYSASASEIVAGALSGLKKACVVGTRSFGKGSVQNLIPINGNQAYLKLTTAHYYLPDLDLPQSDQWYLLHRKPGAKIWGVQPHILVKVIPREINKILRLRRERDVLKGKDQASVPKEILERKPTSSPSEDYPEDPDPTVDPQLVTALDVMRMKLMSDQPWLLPSRMERALTVANPPPSSVTTKQR